MYDEWKANVKAIVSLILSILSILCCCAWYASLILGVVGLILGILGYRDENPNQKDVAIAGIVIGATGVALGVATAVMSIFIMQQSATVEVFECAKGMFM